MPFLFLVCPSPAARKAFGLVIWRLKRAEKRICQFSCKRGKGANGEGKAGTGDRGNHFAVGGRRVARGVRDIGFGSGSGRGVQVDKPLWRW